MEKAKITFKNKTEITAEVNGTCYITDTKPDFPADLSEVTISTNDGEATLKDVEIIEAASTDGRYWFAITELTGRELDYIRTQADIQYIAMMSGIEL